MTIDTLREFFMWCAVINLGLLIWTVVMCATCRGFIVRVHGKMFGLSEATINSMLYGFLAAYKIVFIVFVLVPWIALSIMAK